MKNEQWHPVTMEDKVLYDYFDKCSKITPCTVIVEVPISILGESEKESPPEWRRLDAIKVGSNDNVIKKYYSDEELKNIIKGKKVQIIEVKRLLNRSVIGQVYIGRDFFRDRYNHWDIEMVILTRLKKYNASLLRWCLWNNIKINPNC